MPGVGSRHLPGRRKHSEHWIWAAALRFEPTMPERRLGLGWRSCCWGFVADRGPGFEMRGGKCCAAVTELERSTAACSLLVWIRGEERDSSSPFLLLSERCRDVNVLPSPSQTNPLTLRPVVRRGRSG